MINVNQLTSQLRMMPDQALQRMAQMYKSDPYIFPMVISEDMARKKLRASAQAQAAQPQPKVADQALMSMGEQPQASPGIAGLQAPNMQNMADGGIAGYDDGGFAQHSEPVVRMAEGGVARYAGQDKSLVSLDNYDVLSQFLEDQGLRPAGGETYAERKARERKERELAEAAEAEGRPFARGLKAIESADMSASPATYALQKGASVLRRTMYPSQEELRTQLGVPLAPAPAPAPAAASAGAPAMPRFTSFPSQALERSVVQRPEAPPAPGEKPGATAGAAPAFRSDSSLYSLDPAVLRKRAQGIMPTNEYETAYNVQARKELERLEGREAERERTKPVGKAREGLEALLKKEGEGEAKEMSDAGAFALMRAGLAIAGGASPNALKNIAEGLGVGLQDYQSAVKDLKKAARERKLMLADIEEARRLEAKGDWENAEKRKDDAADRRTSIERFAFSGIQQLKLNQDQIAAGFAKAAQEGGIRRDIAGLEIGAMAGRTAAMTESQERIARIQYAARTEPAAAQAVARVTQAINSSKYLEQLAKMAALGNAAAIEKYREEERRLYLQLAPELMIGLGEGGGKSSSARAAGDAVLNKGG